MLLNCQNLNEIDAAEKDGNTRYWTGNRNTAISAHYATKMIKKICKCISIDKSSLVYEIGMS